MFFYFLFQFYFLQTLNAKFDDNFDLTDLKNILNDNVPAEQWKIDNLKTRDPTQQYYCSLCCILIDEKPITKTCGKHTLCIYPANRTGLNCHGFMSIPLDDQEKHRLVLAHNTLRSYVAQGKELRGHPGPQYRASNMRMLIWDNELAIIAERWAAQCIVRHDTCRDTERFPVGQNIAYGNIASNRNLRFVRNWYNEVKDFDREWIHNNTIPFSRRQPFENYLQLIWADTYLIGCGRVVYQKLNGSQAYYREQLVCNYGPAGKIPNTPAYVIGEPCSNCPEGTDCVVDMPGLCGGVSWENVNTSTEIKNFTWQATNDRRTHHYTIITENGTTNKYYLYQIASIVFILMYFNVF